MLAAKIGNSLRVIWLSLLGEPLAAILTFNDFHALIPQHGLAVFHREMTERPLHGVSDTAMNHARLPMRGNNGVRKRVEKNGIGHVFFP